METPLEGLLTGLKEIMDGNLTIRNRRLRGVPTAAETYSHFIGGRTGKKATNIVTNK
jgi:ABC-type transport system involved in cytochrome c biogenesis ATPase subunit